MKSEVLHVLAKSVAGKYLHNLHNDEPSMDDVKRTVDTCPEALLFKDEDGHIPIQTAVQHVESIKYVPLLAEEAIRKDILVGPKRGGLLLPYDRYDPEFNVLQFVVNTVTDEENDLYDETCTQVLKDLRRAGLLVDKDWTQFDLMGLAPANSSLQRLDYLSETFPKALSIPLSYGGLPIDVSNYYDSAGIDVFATLLKTGMKYYPESFGFLFKRNGNGAMAINQAIYRFGKDEVFKTIRNVIPPTKDYPILHPVIQYTPNLFDDFVYRYPDAIFFKDGRGRQLLHVAAKSGAKLSGSLLLMIHSNKASIEERDPVTNLYPFMLAASSRRLMDSTTIFDIFFTRPEIFFSLGRKKDLTTIYKLLSLRPDLISRCINNGTE